MSAVGIDFGNETCYVAVAKAGGLETVTNDYSQRATPSYVAFGPTSRDLGTSAKNKVITNIKNTVYSFKRLIGKKYHDRSLQHEVSYLPYEIHELPNGSIGVKVSYLGNDSIFTVHQIAAMLLTKLKDITETAYRNTVTDCVVSVPCYFSDFERRALLDVCRIANLNVLRLLNDTTAIALAYGFYKQDLSDSKPKRVMFVDMGHTAIQASVCDFYQGKLKVICNLWDFCVGGRDIDNALVRHFSKEFKTRYNLDVLSNPRAIVRLLQECEKLKKQLSANPQVLPLNIECFMEDKDVSSSLGRDQLEQLCADSFKRVEDILKQLLAQANLSAGDIHAVEIVGGSTRIPAIKNIIKRVTGLEPSTTLNLDEAIACGCALQAAMLSPNVKVRDFSICDAQPYAIKLVWNITKTEYGDIEVFPRNHPVPFSKLLTFFRKEDFTLNAFYSPGMEKESFIGSFTIKNINQMPGGESAKIIIKLRININGIFTISSAVIADKDSKENTNLDQRAEELRDLKKDSSVPVESLVNEEKRNFFSLKKHKKVSQEIELPIEPKVPQLSESELRTFTDIELKMINQDRNEVKRMNAKNSVEECVYELRGHLSDELNPYVDPQELDELQHILTQTEDWLYGDGENQNESVYKEKLKELKKLSNPIYRRKYEFEARTPVMTEFENIIDEATRIRDSYLVADPRFKDIDPKEMEEFDRAISEKQTWWLQQKKVFEELKTCENPPVLVAEIFQMKEQLKQLIIPVLTKAKLSTAPAESSDSRTETTQNTGVDPQNDPNVQIDQPSNNS